MADDEKIKKVLEKAKGKKSKSKSINEEISGTKAKPLPKDLKATLEEHFGANLSQVRLHTGGNAKEIAKSINAKAFAYGQSIYFANDRDAGNNELIAHEVAHALGQGGGKKLPPEKKGTVLVSK